MDRLGLNKYIIQGTDWGSTVIVDQLVTLCPDKIYGYHTLPYVNNLKDILASIYPPLKINKENSFELYHYLNQITYLMEASGLLYLQTASLNTTGII